MKAVRKIEGEVQPQRWGPVVGDMSVLWRGPVNSAGRTNEHRRRATENIEVLNCPVGTSV